jgi:hypothetical protein
MKESVFVPIVDEREVITKKTGPGRRKQSIKRQRRTRPRGRGKIVYFVLFFSFVVIIDVCLANCVLF